MNVNGEFLALYLIDEQYGWIVGKEAGAPDGLVLSTVEPTP